VWRRGISVGVTMFNLYVESIESPLVFEYSDEPSLLLVFTLLLTAIEAGESRLVRVFKQVESITGEQFYTAFYAHDGKIVMHEDVTNPSIFGVHKSVKPQQETV